MNRFHANLGLGGLVGGNMMNDNATTYDETFENIQASKILVWPQTKTITKWNPILLDPGSLVVRHSSPFVMPLCSGI